METNTVLIILLLIIIGLLLFILINLKVFTNLKICKSYIDLYSSFKNERAKSEADTRNLKRRGPLSCADAKTMAIAFQEFVGASSTDPAVIAIPNTELAALISGRAAGETLLVFGRRNEGSGKETCVILFPQKPNSGIVERDNTYVYNTLGTHETFPVRARLNNVNYNTLFNCTN